MCSPRLYMYLLSRPVNTINLRILSLTLPGAGVFLTLLLKDSPLDNLAFQVWLLLMQQLWIKKFLPSIKQNCVS